MTHSRSFLLPCLRSLIITVVFAFLAVQTRADTANTQAVVTAANNFLASLTASQRTAIDATSANVNTSAQYNFKLANAEVWSNLPVGGTTRNGLQFASLSDTQLSLALAVADAALSTSGTTLLEEIRAADRYISGEVTNAKGTTSSMWGYKKYYIAFVGTPSTTSAWTLQIGGHHLAYNITYNGTYASGTPMFAGNEPNSWTDSTGTYAPLGTQRSLLVALRSTLGTTALLAGTYSDVVFGPNGTGNHDTIQPKSYPTSGRGQLYSTLTSAQQAQVRSYIEAWVNTQTSSIANELLATYESDAALAETYVGYAGSSTTLSTNGSYFRVDGPRLWIEFVVQGGVYDQSGVHDHGVFRDKLSDYGAAYGSTTISTTVRPPTISAQPQSQSIGAGSTVTFSVTATGTPNTLTYQWYKDGVAVDGATASTYTVTGATVDEAGGYYVIVTNAAGVATSTTATLTVSTTAGTTPTITTQPVSQTIAEGSSVTFSVAATGTDPLTYQWYKDSVAISGATSANYAIAAVATADAGSYTVTVANSVGSATSSAATLTVTTASGETTPTITTQPVSLSVLVGASATFSVAASGTGTLAYQWYKDGVAIDGAVASTYTVAATALTDAGAYTVVVSNNVGSVTSSAATLTVATAETPTVNVKVLGNGQVVEGGQKGKLLFTRTGGDTTSGLTVYYQLKGTATNKKDYRDGSGVALSGAVVIPAGAVSLKYKIVARDDLKLENTEKIVLKLLASPASEYTLGTSIKAKLKIVDND